MRDRWWGERAVVRLAAPGRTAAPLAYLLALLAGGLWLVEGQLDAVLGRMGAIGAGVRGSALGFPWAPADIGRYACAWARYAGLAPAGGDQVATPDELLWRLTILDLALVVVLVPLVGTVLGRLLRWAEREFSGAVDPGPFPGPVRFVRELARDVRDEVVRLWRVRPGRAARAPGDGAVGQSTRGVESLPAAGSGGNAIDRPASADLAHPAGDRFDRARVRLLRWAVGALLVYVVADVIEDVLVVVRYVVLPPAATGMDALLVVPTWVKAFAVAVVLGPVVVASGTALRRSPVARGALVGARGVVVVVALLLVLLVLLPLGAQQVDDVIRAWQWDQAAVAAVTTAMAALVVVGAARELTDRTPENLRPGEGRDPQALLLLGGLVLTAVGGVVWWLTGAWGLLVPAGMLLGLFALGSVIVRPDPPGALKRPTGRDPATAAAGIRLARTLGAVVCLVAVWTIVRASAFDVLARPGPSGSGLVLIPTAVLVGGIGLVVVLVRRRADRPPVRPWWLIPAAVAVVVLGVTLLPGDATGIGLPAAIGTVGVVLLGVTAAAGLLAMITVGVRRSGVSGYSLVPVFRLVGLRRFPVIGLLLVWALVVGQLDPGGFHDVRRIAGDDRLAPNLLDAYTAWRGTGTGARPLVIVAAQGGGIRAAVWTALVMECLFGPTRVDAGGRCPGGDAGGDRTPVFLASGASGGSVGLAAWSARRVDIADDPAAATDTGSVLPADHLAPDIARLLTGDALYPLLAHDLPDRAALLERSWEPQWQGVPGEGLSRGMRAAYEQADGDGRWEIPVLAMNGAQVEDGCRFLASPVDMWLPRVPGATHDDPDLERCGSAPGAAGDSIDVLPRTTELVDYLCPDQDVPLSAAAHLSSRFPYISPTARVVTGRCADQTGLLPAGSATAVTDGGVADNSGADTAVQVWRALQPVIAAGEPAGGCVVPIFVQIDNEVDAEPADAGQGPPAELVAPGEALLSQLGGRESAAREEARSSFAAARTATGRSAAPGSAYVRIAPAVQPGAAAPLGWTLSPATVRDMRDQLTAGSNAAALDRVRQLLSGGLACT